MEIPVASGPPPCLGTCRLRAHFPSGAEEKCRVIAEVLERILGPGSSQLRDAFALRLCLDEAIQNAIVHGNSRDPAKRVEVSLYESEDAWHVLVRDEGRGFQPREVPDPRRAGGLLCEGGRGLLILREYMDEVAYYEGGRAVLLRRSKVRRPEHGAGPGSPA